MTVYTIGTILVFIAFAAFVSRRTMTYLHALQQDDYDAGRLFKWMRKNKVFDKRLSFFMLIIGGLALHPSTPDFTIQFLIFISFAIITYKEKDPRKQAKKKFVLTKRAKRLYFPSVFISALAGIWILWGGHPWLWILNIQLIPFILIFVTESIQPFEEFNNNSFSTEAINKLKSMNPTIVGITGSFGKTSVKHILGHILRLNAPTLITPGSVNTAMGITRIIREQLDENHKFLVVEMGAYGKGSIERLCRLTPPNFGVISAIGHAHYERFRSLDTVARTKFELAEAVIANQGKAIVHERTLKFSYPRDMKTNNPDSFVVCGDPAHLVEKNSRDVSYIADGDVQVIKAEQMATGLMMALSYMGEEYLMEVPLYGIHHAHNVALAFACAMAMGLDANAITRTFKTLPQIAHRLEVKKIPGGVTIVDDSYNSNPIGFRSALDVLKILSDTNKEEEGAGRAILVTPGMVEMGSAHEEAHRTIGEIAGHVCDVVIVVLPDRIPSFINGIQRAGSGSQIVEVDTFSKAQEWIDNNKQAGDVILLENDLPDLYERVPKL